MSTFLTGVMLAVVAALLARELKISEFRQKWIDELRQDIAEYISACRAWFHLAQGHYEAGSGRTIDDAREIDKAANVALEIRSRIQLRIKLNGDELERDFLASLERIQDMNLPEDRIESEWANRAALVVNISRKLLKREWETTKYFWRRWAWARTIEGKFHRRSSAA